MEKKKGVFGEKIAFSITARRNNAGQAAVAPPAQGGLRDSPTNLSTTPQISPGPRCPPKNSLTTTTTPHQPPFARGLRCSPKNSSSATTPPSPPPPPRLRSSPKKSSSKATPLALSTSLPGISPSSPEDPAPQPPALPLKSAYSSPTGVAPFCCDVLLPRSQPSYATVKDKGTVESRPLVMCDESINSGPLKLLSSKRTYFPSPNGWHMSNNAAASESQFSHQITPECQAPNDGVVAKENDQGASIGMDRNRDGLLKVTSQEPSKITEQLIECDYQDWNQETEEKNQVSLKFLLASNSKRTYLQPPTDSPAHSPSLLKTPPCQSSTKFVKQKSYRKTGSSTGKTNDLASDSAENSKKRCCYTYPMRSLEHFLLNRELTKMIELPGTSSPCRVTTSSRMEIRLILRRIIRLIYKLHREGYCLDGSFGLGNFLVDGNLFITLEYRAEDRNSYSKKGACKDLQSFVKMVQSDIFGSQDIPSEIMRWLSLIQKAGIDCEYLICYDCALMEHNQILSTFMQLYSKLQAMKKSDSIGYKFVLDQLRHFHGWSDKTLHNDYFIETYWGADKKRKWRDRGRRKRMYREDVMSMLRLIRNTFQHITLKRIDKTGNVMFGEEEYEYMLHDQFPMLLAELMEAMYMAAYLADLNLEHVMV